MAHTPTIVIKFQFDFAPLSHLMVRKQIEILLYEEVRGKFMTILSLLYPPTK